MGQICDSSSVMTTEGGTLISAVEPMVRITAKKSRFWLRGYIRGYS